MRLGREHGFTLTELLMAALVFAVVGLVMGAYYVFTVQRVEEGGSRAELQKNSSLALQTMADAIHEAARVIIPAEGEPLGSTSSFTAHFPSEPFVDEKLNGIWDSTGTVGPCAPMEFFEDLNGNGVWDSEPWPARSFRLSGGQLEVREGDGSWTAFLENRYSAAGASSVWLDDLIFTQDSQDLKIIRTDTGDDLIEASQLRVRQKS